MRFQFARHVAAESDERGARLESRSRFGVKKKRAGMVSRYSHVGTGTSTVSKKHCVGSGFVSLEMGPCIEC